MPLLSLLLLFLSVVFQVEMESEIEVETEVEIASETESESEVEEEVVLGGSSGSLVDRHSQALLSDAGTCHRSDSSPFGFIPR